MTASDFLLEQTVRTWAESWPVRVSVRTETAGGLQGVAVHPFNARAAEVVMWVADDDISISFSVGRNRSWWEAGVTLHPDTIRAVLDAVAYGRFEEHVRRRWRSVVAVRSALTIGAKTIRASSGWGVLAFPWEKVAYTPYLTNEQTNLVP